MGFFSLDEYTYWEQTEPNSNLKNLSCRKDFFQKQTKFSEGNNVLYAAAPNIDSFLWKDTCVSSTQLNWPFGTQTAYLHLETPKLQEVFLLKLAQF
jgi:hypothetical protein